MVNDILGLGATPDSAQAIDAYAICIQAGAILAVLLLYRGRIGQMIDGVRGRHHEGRAILHAVVLAFVPTAIIGYVFRDLVRENLFGPTPIAAAWIAGGLGLLLLDRSGITERRGRSIHEITPLQAVLIGLGQAIALWPGMSRSLAAIVAALLIGLSLSAAVEFSFLLGLVTLVSATALVAFEDGKLLVDTFGIATPLLGLMVAFLSATAAVQWMVAWLQSRGLGLFGYYRLAIGLATLAAIDQGWP